MIAENNFVALENVPVFYWPWMSMSMQNKSLYIRRFALAHDSTFGTQVRTGWNPYQIFNIKQCNENTDWVNDLDYLSQRGLGHGTTYTYNVDSIFGYDTRAIGMANYYGIYDRGTDNLGLGRRDDPFPNNYRTAESGNIATIRFARLLRPMDVRLLQERTLAITGN